MKSVFSFIPAVFEILLSLNREVRLGVSIKEEVQKIDFIASVSFRGSNPKTTEPLNTEYQLYQMAHRNCN